MDFNNRNEDLYSFMNIIFLIGFTNKNDSERLYALRLMFESFFKQLKKQDCLYDSCKLMIDVMQYSKEGIKTIFHECIDDYEKFDIPVISIEAWGTAVSPFHPLFDLLQWIDVQKSNYRSIGQSYFPFHIVFFPEKYIGDISSLDKKTLIKFIENNSVISCFGFDNSEDNLKMYNLTKEVSDKYCAYSDFLLCLKNEKWRYNIRRFEESNIYIDEIRMKLNVLEGLASMSQFIPKQEWIKSFDV